MFLTILFMAMIIVCWVDARQKRRNYLRTRK
jgi:hypothetical protein